jgi:hypothetical protein
MTFILIIIVVLFLINYNLLIPYIIIRIRLLVPKILDL